MKNHTFIFVEDQKILRDNLPHTLNWDELGFEFLTSFDSASKALEYMQTNHVDLVLTDIKLGKESGLELAKSIHEDFPNTLVILISAYKEFEYARTGIQYGILEYLVKPTSYNQLVNAFTLAKKKLVSSCPIDEISYDTLIEKAIQYINEHLSEGITRNDVAEHVNMNPNYLGKYFKKHTGYHFVDYINIQRIEKAKELLKDPTNKVYEICYYSGYKSMHYFISIFKQLTGFTPKEYRIKNSNRSKSL